MRRDTTSITMVAEDLNTRYSGPKHVRSAPGEAIASPLLPHANRNARWVPFALLAMLPLVVGCSFFSTTPPAKSAPTILSAGALLPSPRLVVGRIVAIDAAERLAFIELAPDAPKGALLAGTELAVRTLALSDSGRLQVSPYLRGRTLGTKILAGQPSPGDEVVWLAP